jgi:hypothetical protein
MRKLHPLPTSTSKKAGCLRTRFGIDGYQLFNTFDRVTLHRILNRAHDEFDIKKSAASLSEGTVATSFAAFMMQGAVPPM